MSDAHATPFIPPMGPLPASPQPNPRNGPPQLPTHQPNEPLPAWASTVQHAASYPAWPHSTPYGPPPPHMTPMSGPTMYIPGNYQPTAPPVIPPAPGGRSPYFLPNGLSSDYTGYPDSPSAFNGRQAPGTPAPPSAPVIPPPPASAGPVFPPPSMGPPHMSGGTPYNPHQPPLPGGYFNGPPSAPAGYGWGPPPAPGGYAPFGQPYSAGPYGGGMYSTPWQPPNMSFGPPSAGMMPGGWPGGPMTGPPPPHSQLPPGPPPQAFNPIPIPTIYEGDRVGKFMAGPHYGPVLDNTVLPFLVSKLQLNPLIEPVPESGPDADRPHLKWSMLFPASHCQRSTDPTHVSWSKGRSEPATWPRVDRIRILSKTFPWTIEVIASNPDEGVTCGDIIERIGDEMYKITPGGEFKSLSSAMQAAVGKSYHFNRSRAHGVPGGRLGDGLRKLDFLGQEAVFGGIVDDPGYIKQIVGAVLPATFLLRCVRQYALTAEELREHEEQQRRIDEEAEAASARSAKSGRSRSRAPSRAPSDNGLT